jgi:hypothetical protein
MGLIYNERIGGPHEGVKMGLEFMHIEPLSPLASAKGTVIFDMRDAKTGEVIAHWERSNILTKDCGILAARLFRNSRDPSLSLNNGLTMLAIGTGATGNVLNPDAPQNTQRALNNEVCRKPFSSAQFRNEDGVAVAYPTHIVDFTATYGEAEAVGPLNEMGLMSTASPNPTVKHPIPAYKSGVYYDPTFDVTGYDLMANYLTFGVVTKPSTAILTITWRLTF